MNQTAITSDELFLIELYPLGVPEVDLETMGGIEETDYIYCPASARVINLWKAAVAHKREIAEMAKQRNAMVGAEMVAGLSHEKAIEKVASLWSTESIYVKEAARQAILQHMWYLARKEAQELHQNDARVPEKGVGLRFYMGRVVIVGYGEKKENRNTNPFRDMLGLD